MSVAGTSMSAIAIPWLVLTTTGSPTRTGFVVFAQLLPYVTTQLLAGPVVDRLGLRPSFVRGNAAAAVAIAAVPVCHALDVLTLGLPFGAVAGGYGTEAWGLHAALWVFGAAYLVTTLAPFVFPSWRRLDEHRAP